MWKRCITVVRRPTKPASCCAPTHNCSTRHWSPLVCLTGIICTGKYFQILTRTLLKGNKTIFNTIFGPQTLENTKRCLSEHTYFGECKIPGYFFKGVRYVGPAVVWFASHTNTLGYLPHPRNGQPPPGSSFSHSSSFRTNCSQKGSVGHNTTLLHNLD